MNAVKAEHPQLWAGSDPCRYLKRIGMELSVLIEADIFLATGIPKSTSCVNRVKLFLRKP
jgi:hypothetical protein